jgi:cytochrome c
MRLSRKLFLFVIVITPLLFAPALFAQPSTAEGFNVLVFSKTMPGLYRHQSIEAGVAAIKKLGAENHFQVDATEDSEAFSATNLAKYKAIVFLSTIGDVLNEEQQAAFRHFIEAGGGFAAIHAAVAGMEATEPSWPWYSEMFAAGYVSHPPVMPATVVVEDKTNPSTAQLPDRWRHVDEWYNFTTSPRGKAHILATVDERTYFGGSMGQDHPVIWTRDIGKGRMWYTALGHTDACFSDPLFLQQILGGIQFVAQQK